MIVKNKQESDFIIKKLGLNRMTECSFTAKNINEISSFFKTHSYPYYNLRDKSNSSGVFLYKLTKEEILNEIKNYDMFSIYESLNLADEKLVLQGEIQLNEKFILLASLSDIKGISNREAMKNPVYKIDIDLKEKREPSIKGLTEIIDYIVEHNLIGVIVEFSIYEIPLGVNSEKILIWELRNY